MLKLVCFAAVVASVCGQHQLYPGDPGYQAGYQSPQGAYQGAYQGANPGAYQQGPASYQGAPSQYQDQPITATNYRTDDGQQRSETRDNEGNVKGQYSYVDPNGKTISVKYTAGKDGFQVEGDHLPRAPVAQAPSGPASQGQYNSYQQAQSRAAAQFPGQPTPARAVTQQQQPHYQRQPQSFEQEQQYQLQQQQQLQMQQVQQQTQQQQQQQQVQLQQLQQLEQQQIQQNSLQAQPQYTPQQYQQPQPQYQQPQPQYQQSQPQYQPQQYQQYQQPQQQQQYQSLANFPGQSQHRFGAPQAGGNANVDPTGSYNHQFDF